MGESKDKAKTKEKKTPFFKGLKAEFNKIIWPDKTTLTKQTAVSLWQKQNGMLCIPIQGMKTR